MTHTVWYITKPGETRTFASTKPPSPHWAASIKKQGYSIFRVEFQMKGWDSASEKLEGEIKEINSEFTPEF